MLKKTFLASTSLTLAAAVALPSYAQDSYEDEIIITATKRETTLQETPVAVTVTPSIEIERAKIFDVNDLQSVVPSLRVNQLQSSQNTNFIIRGSGNGANNGGIESSVGVFVDGVYRSRSSARVNDLPKLERVEVLKGPQSTLFGKNASAGVISIVTAAPSFDTEGYAEATYGNYNLINVKGYGTTGVSDTVAVSLGGSYTQRDGYFESADASLPDTNNRDRWNVRGQALFEPSDDVEFRLIADYSQLNERCCGVANFVSGPVTGIFQALSGLTTPTSAPLTDPFSYLTYQNSESNNEIEDYGISLNGDIEVSENMSLTSITSYRSNDSFYISDADYSRTQMLDAVSSDLGVETFTQELRVNIDLDEAVTTTIGGYFFDEAVTQGSSLDYGAALRPYLDFLIGDPAVLAGLEATNGFANGTFGSADVTINESFKQDNTAWSIFGTMDVEMGEKFSFTGGLNYTQDTKNVSGETINPDVFSSIDVAGEAGINFFTVSTYLTGQPNFGIGSFQDTFGLPFSEANVFLLASGGAGPAAQQGWFAYSAGVNAFATATAQSPLNPLLGIRAFQTQPQFVPFPNAIEDGRTKDKKLTWQARLSYEMDEDTNVYGSIGTGFKASSWNLSRDSRPAAGDFTALDNAGLLENNVSPGTRFAGPETVTNYEIGLKKRLDNGFVNVALFQQDFEDLQTNAFVGAAFVLTNAGESRIRGAEIDAGYELIDGLNLKGAVTFLDPEFTDFQNASGPAGPIDLTGERPDNISKLSVSLGGSYDFTLSEGLDAYIRADWQYESPTTISRNLTPESLDISATQPGLGAFYNPAARTIVDGYFEREQSIVNASAGIDFDNGFGVQVWGRNIFDDQYISTLFPGVFQFGVVNGYPSPPAMYGVTGRYNF